MGVFNNITNALNAKLASIPAIPQVMWPNEGKEPTQGVSFVRPTLLPAASQVYTLTDENYHSGIYQVDIYVKLKNGSSQALLIADAIREAYNRQTLNSSGTRVFIQNISMSQAQREDAWWRVFIEINYVTVA